MSNYRILLGDCRETLRALPAEMRDLLLAAASALRHDPNALRRRTLHIAADLEAAAREIPDPSREPTPTSEEAGYAEQ